MIFLKFLYLNFITNFWIFELVRRLRRQHRRRPHRFPDGQRASRTSPPSRKPATSTTTAALATTTTTATATTSKCIWKFHTSVGKHWKWVRTEDYAGSKLLNRNLQTMSIKDLGLTLKKERDDYFLGHLWPLLKWAIFLRHLISAVSKIGLSLKSNCQIKQACLNSWYTCYTFFNSCYIVTLTVNLTKFWFHRFLISLLTCRVCNAWENVTYYAVAKLKGKKALKKW